MGGCCCSARKPHLHGTPVYYYCTPPLEGREPFTSNEGSGSSFTARFLVGLQLETSIPDFYRSPPVPLPYDVDFSSKSSGETVSGNSLETITTFDQIEEPEPKDEANSSVLSPKKMELSKSREASALQVEEEDGCPICLEEYDLRNPKLMTNCEHHFHLSCILEWMERSETCPICDQKTLPCEAPSSRQQSGESLMLEEPLYLQEPLQQSPEMQHPQPRPLQPQDSHREIAFVQHCHIANQDLCNFMFENTPSVVLSV